MKVGPGLWLGKGFSKVGLKDSVARAVDAHLSHRDQNLLAARREQRGERWPGGSAAGLGRGC